jgi:3-deoxy-D-manno-octulosonic-acid transferase
MPALRLILDWTLYRLALLLAVPLIPLRLVWRGRRERGYLAHWGERLGAAAVPAGAIWIHAVSVGEMRAAQPLLDEMRARHPGRPLLLTCMTPTGRATAESLYGGFARIAYLPYDYSFLVQRFLRRAKPAVGILMETELWPNLIRAADKQGVPLMLANARLSERSARGYARLPALTRVSLARLAVVATQTEADAARLRELGARTVHVTGNLKFDITPPADMLARGAAWRAVWGTRPVLLAASTREGEEALLLHAFAAAAPAEVLLVLVPRHPQRFDEVARLVGAAGLSYVRRSAETPPDAATRVLLGDSLGELFAYYAACDVAFVGGSLAPLGGQNLIEAASVGRPVLVGPHTFNFEEATRRAIKAGAARRVHDAADCMAQTLALLADASARARMGEAGLAFAARHCGAAARTAALVPKP